MTAMHASRRRARRRGRSRVEVILLVCLAIVIVAVAWPMLARARRAGDPAADAHDLGGAFQAMVAYANGHGGLFPRPSEAATHDGSDPALDTSAHLYALLLADRGVAARQLISRAERNPAVEAIDYDFRQVNPAEGRLWDPGFRTELDRPPGEGVCHTSYVHLALCGDRAARWRPSSGVETVLLGDRATRRGTQEGKAWTRSYTMGRNGRPEGLWGGNLVFGDGHVELLTTFRPPGVTWTCGSIKPTKDNIFDCEFNQLDCTNAVRDGRIAGDVWLCLVDHVEGPHHLGVDVVERLEDGSMPR